MRTLVSSLLLSRGPAAVTRFVVAFIVYAVEGKSSGTLSHIVQKVNKLFPTLADRDSTPPIIFPCVTTRSGASAPHGLPTAIRRSRIPAAGVPMRYASIGTYLPSFTSTTHSSSRSQMPRFHNGGSPAITAAFPPRFAAHAIDRLYDCKTAESVTRTIFPAGMGMAYKPAIVRGKQHV